MDAIRGFDWGATMATMQHWFTGKVAADAQVISTDDAARLWNDSLSIPPAAVPLFHMTPSYNAGMQQPPALEHAPAAVPLLHHTAPHNTDVQELPAPEHAHTIFNTLNHTTSTIPTLPVTSALPKSPFLVPIYVPTPRSLASRTPRASNVSLYPYHLARYAQSDVRPGDKPKAENTKPGAKAKSVRTARRKIAATADILAERMATRSAANAHQGLHAAADCDEDVPMHVDEDVPTAGPSNNDNSSDHDDEMPVTPAVANEYTPMIISFDDGKETDPLADDDGMDRADDAVRKMYQSVNRERTANDFYYHGASQSAAPMHPLSFAMTVQPASPPFDTDDEHDDLEDQLKLHLAALNETGNISLDGKSTRFVMAIIDSFEAVASVALKYTNPNRGGSGLTILIADNLAHEILFTNVATDTLSHCFRHSPNLLACEEFTLDLSLRYEHYHALAGTTLRGMTDLNVKVGHEMDSTIWDLEDDLVVLALPALQTISYSVDAHAVLSQAQGAEFVARHIDHDGTADVFTMSG